MPWVLALPFMVACLASGVRFIMFATMTPPRTPGFPFAFPATAWLAYAMLVVSMILEWRQFNLRSRPARVRAYRLVLISNAFAPIIHTLFTLPSSIDPEGLILRYALFGGLLFPLVSWATVTFLCVFKDRASKVPGRVLPAGFAIVGSVENCTIAFGILMTI